MKSVRILLSYLIFLITTTSFVNGQYSLQDIGNRLVPLPSGEVVVFNHEFGYLLNATRYDSLGVAGDIPVAFSERIGDGGTYAFNGNKLAYQTGVYFDYDILEDLGIFGLNVSEDSISINYARSQPPNYSGFTRSIAFLDSTEFEFVTSTDSIFLFSDTGQLVNKLPLSETFFQTHALTANDIVQSAKFTVLGQSIGPNGTLAIQHYSEDGTLLKNDLYQEKYIGHWTKDKRSFVFFKNGFVEIGVDTIVAYPPTLATPSQAYNAIEFAVVRNRAGKYYSFDPILGFVLIGQSSEVEFTDILKQPSGWFSFTNGIVTYHPDSLAFPRTNPFKVRITADSAIVRVEEVPNMNIFVSTYSLAYRLELTNTSAEDIASAVIQILGPANSFDPWNPGAFAQTVTIENIEASATAFKSGSFSYRMPGNVPHPFAAISACIISYNDESFLGGEDPCGYFSTSVSDLKSHIKGIEESVHVFPNPIQGFFTVESTSQIENLQIINVHGQVVEELKANAQTNYQIESDIAPGYYTLRISFNNGSVVYKRILVT